jgi:hypothetical protein
MFLEANIFEDFALFWIIGGVWFLASLKQRRDDAKQKRHNEWIQERIDAEQERIHGTNVLDKYHWGGKYELLNDKKEFKGKPPIWIGDRIQLVWYFDKPGHASQRKGFYETYYLVTAFEEYIIVEGDENYPIRKHRYVSGEHKPIITKINSRDKVFVNSKYKDGSTRKHKVSYLGPRYNRNAKLFYIFDYPSGTEIKCKSKNLDTFVIDKIIELKKLSNSQKAYGHFDYDDHGDVWLDKRELYLHLKEIRNIPMHNYLRVMKRVKEDRKSLNRISWG